MPACRAIHPALLALLVATVQRLEVEDGLCAALLRTLGRGWPALLEVSLVGGAA